MYVGYSNCVDNQALNDAITQRAQINRIFKLLVKHIKNNTLNQIFEFSHRSDNYIDVYRVTRDIVLEVIVNDIGSDEYKFRFIVNWFPEIQKLFKTPVYDRFDEQVNTILFSIKRDKLDYFRIYPVISDVFVDHLLYDLKQKVTKPKNKTKKDNRVW